MQYRAPGWLPGGHWQTIYPAKFIATPTLPWRRERWDTPDGDFIDVDFIDGQPGQPLVVLFHGLEGSSNSHYARALMAEVAKRGWHGAVPHFRGCSGQLNCAPRFYHSGDAHEIDWILRRLHQRHTSPAGLTSPPGHAKPNGHTAPDGPITGNTTADGHPAGAATLYVAGVSLGGNALLRWLGEFGHAAEFVTAACAVSAPLDLVQGGAALGRGFNRLYTHLFLRTLKPKCLEKLKQYPGLFDREQMLRAQNLYQFDDIVTAPLHGYRDVNDYWQRASAKHVLFDITVPTLILNAQNDPFLPGQYLPQQAASCVTLEYPRHGGHVGFASGKLPGHLNWLPGRILNYFTDGRA